MFDYYTNYPICPKCGTPLFENKLEYIEDDNIKCLNCFNVFKSILNLDDCGFSLKNKTSIKKVADEIPLFKDISLNSIEESYMDWIKKGVEGNFLVTWPWSSVKFIPELVFEYLSEFPKNKVVVVGEMDSKSQKIGSPKADSLYDELFYVDEYKNNIKINGELSIDDVFLKSRHVGVYVKPIKNKFSRYKEKYNPKASLLYELYDDYPIYKLTKKYDEEHYRRFKEDFIENFKRLYGENSIANVRQANRTAEKDSEFGIFNLSFFDSNIHDPNLEFEDNFVQGFENAAKNMDVIKKCSDQFSSLSIYNKEEFNNYEIDDYSVFFINENIENYSYFKDTFDFINRINPDLIIIENVDSHFGDIIQFNKGFYFKKLLKNNASMLMFSTNLNYRSIYRIGEYKNFLNSNNIIPHTWDYDDILTKLLPDYQEFNCCGSSKFNEIHKDISSINVDYVEISQLNEIEGIFNFINEELGNKQSIEEFLGEILKSPLYIKGSPSDKRTLRRENFTIESILTDIFNINENFCDEIVKIFDRIYNFNNIFYPKNPLFDKICDMINEFKDSNLVIVVHKRDVKGVKLLLNDVFDEDEVSNIIVCDWSSINDELDSDKEYLAISTLEPLLSYDLHESNINSLYLLGTSNYIEDLKLKLRMRFEEFGVKPVYILSDNEEAPQLLKDTLNELTSIPELPEDFKREDLRPIFIPKDSSVTSNDWDVEVDREIEDSFEDHDYDYNKYKYHIDVDSECLLVITSEDEGMFLPFNKTIYIQNDFGGIEEVLIDNKAKSHFVNKNIILDDRGFYSSFRLIFMDFIIKNGRDTPIRYGQYYWKGYDNLILNAFEWLNLLRVCTVLEMGKIGHSFNYTSEILANELSKLGLNARNPVYIKEFWFEDPLFIKDGEEQFCIYEREHTRSVNDTVKIYQWIKDNYMEDINISDAYKCYEAAVVLQRIRRGFLQHEIQNLTQEQYDINNEFQLIVKEIMDNSKKFHVSFAGQVRLSKKVVPFKIIKNYRDYFK